MVRHSRPAQALADRSQHQPQARAQRFRSEAISSRVNTPIFVCGKSPRRGELTRAAHERPGPAAEGGELVAVGAERRLGPVTEAHQGLFTALGAPSIERGGDVVRRIVHAPSSPGSLREVQYVQRSRQRFVMGRNTLREYVMTLPHARSRRAPASGMIALGSCSAARRRAANSAGQRNRHLHGPRADRGPERGALSSPAASPSGGSQKPNCLARPFCHTLEYSSTPACPRVILVDA